MPIVEINLIEGRPPEKIRELIRRVHDAVEGALEAPASSIRILVREIPPAHWAAGGVTKDEKS
ncbi:tautomerase family protein [Amycolatopsis pithecellobii]|uniref:4-oxalocrotonate tautomerase n=1 Tax=Amycolatopsis pithecellobii TaxID=664692 RepID=A0A6N7Z724_9PSEU|nr:tautomerase family protein [Amycolatopsis pithecellobii]MTD56891.1 4-oxalocrotonate tautomerase [Amycolatopsis pithecellobii]